MVAPGRTYLLTPESRPSAGILAASRSAYNTAVVEVAASAPVDGASGTCASRPRPQPERTTWKMVKIALPSPSCSKITKPRKKFGLCWGWVFFFLFFGGTNSWPRSSARMGRLVSTSISLGPPRPPFHPVSCAPRPRRSRSPLAPKRTSALSRSRPHHPVAQPCGECAMRTRSPAPLPRLHPSHSSPPLAASTTVTTVRCSR